MQANCGRWLAVVLLCGLATGCSLVRSVWRDQTLESQRLAEEARQAENRGDLEQAGNLLSRAIRTNPEDAEVHRQLGLLLLSQGRTAAAVEHLRTAVAQTPDDAQGNVQLAQVLVRQGRYAEAARPLNAALLLDPDHVEALLLEASLAERRNQRPLALETYHRVLRSDPGNVEANLRIAAIQLDSEHAERASPLLRSVCQSLQATAPQQAEARWSLGIAYSRQQRWNDAVSSLSAAAGNRDHMNADDWYRLAYARYQTGDLTGAWRDLSSALRQQPDHASAQAMASAVRSVKLGSHSAPSQRHASQF
jgi:tetratricopeptide (TPR) repeat protein